MRLVIRPILVVLALGALVVALAQVSGRVLIAGLDRLEPAANSYLDDRGLRLTGLRGGWSGLNPVVRVERLEFPGGFVSELVVELDWLETLARSHLVLRHGAVADGLVRLHRRPDGSWGLPGGPAGEMPDLVDALWHSDQLNFAGDLVFSTEAGRSAPLAVAYQAVNRAGRHRARLTVANGPDACDDGCSLLLEFESREGFWRFTPRLRQLSLDADGLRLPAELIGPGVLQLASIDLDWAERGGASSGQARLAVTGYPVAGSEPLALSLEAASSGAGDDHQLALSEVSWRLGDRGWEGQSWQGSYGDELLQIWTAELDVGRVAGLLRASLAGVPAANRWLGNLRPGGLARNVRFYFRPGSGELGYAATLADARIDSYKGVPRVRGGGAEVIGYGRGMRFNVNSTDTELGFLETFPESWFVDYGQGVVDLWFDGDYVGLRGRNLRAEAGATRASGGFAVANPAAQRDRQQLSLLLVADAMSWQEARRFIPVKLPAGLPEWLDTGPRQGDLSDLRLAYRGALHSLPGAADRRVELAASVRRGSVQFDPAWPLVEDAAGRVAVSGDQVRVSIDQGRSAGAALHDSRLLLGDKAAYALLQLDSEYAADELLGFVRATPLADWLTFIEPDWQADGPVGVSGRLRVPLRSAPPDDAAAEPAADAADGTPEPAAAPAGAGPGLAGDGDGVPEDLEVDLQFDFRGVDLDLPGYRLTLAELEGRLDYRYPYGLDSADLRGRLFDRPARFTAGNDGEAVLFTAAGRAAPTDVYALAALDDPGLVSGETDFEARIRLPVQEADVPRISLRSELAGIAVELPAGLGKTAEAARDSRAELVFLDDYLALSFDYTMAQGWLHVDETLLRGAVGFDQPAPKQTVAQSDLVLAGRLPALSIDELLPAEDGGDAFDWPVPVRLEALAFAEVLLGEFPVSELVVSGTLDSDGIELSVDAPLVAGRIRLPRDGVLNLDLDRVTLPAGDEDEGDPLSPDIIADLPVADVRVVSFRVGEEDYGSWSFELRPQPDGLRLGKLTAQVKGAEIEAESGVFWHATDDRSEFDGLIRTGDLAEVLPQWGYAPSLTSEWSSLEGQVAWDGSPANVDLDRLEGTIFFRAEEGHFQDVEGSQGALRMVSLLNFSTVLERMRFDFSDVTGRGVSYQKIKAPLAFDRGMLRFTDPVQIDGSGSSFRINGSVNLLDGTLDNEMIVTLPVSKSLPWYAAYVALANPLAGLGVLVGQQVLRKPLEQFSSAKYDISGTIDNPEVKFVNVWDTSMDQEQVAAAASEPDPAASEPGSAASEAGTAASEAGPAGPEAGAAAPDSAGADVESDTDAVAEAASATAGSDAPPAPPGGGDGAEPPDEPQPDVAAEAAEPKDIDET